MALNPADIAALSRLLDEGLALEAIEREAWLAALPAEQQRHAQALRDMLAQEARLATDNPLQAMPQLASDEAEAHADDRVGPYRLLREIGRGGMGTVWLAARADGSFKREVALKLPRLAWGAGLAERMAREREIGALLEHPHIARLYDAGVDERGRPFIAMEYIPGQPIDVYCREHKLDVRARLRLFVQVVRAVAYAHGRLVIHRDLKPANVVVGVQGDAHLLDFGIAKLIDEAAAVGPSLTQQQGRVLTPRYASPEQLAGEPVGVQADVYSLGVLLYELLTGTLPHAPKRHTLGAMEEAILEGDVALASSRVNDKALARSLRGEVDAILIKAMQREPGRRYATAEALAEDIERHLAGETVKARPDSTAYRMRKALRRNWLGVSAGTAVLVAILVGSGVALIQSQPAMRATEREQVVKDFVADMLRASMSTPSTGGSLRDEVERTVGNGVKLIQARFAKQPGLQAELFGVVGSVYSSMGAFEYGAEYRQRHVSQLKALGADVYVQAQAELGLAEDLLQDNKYALARVHVHQALALSSGNDYLMAQALSAKLRTQLWGNEPAAVEATLRELESALARLPNETVAHAWLHVGRGAWHTTENRASLTPDLTRKGIDVALRVEGRLSSTAIAMQIILANQVSAIGDTEEANQHLNTALAALRERGGPDAIRAAYIKAMARQVYPTKRNETYAEAIEGIADSQRLLEAAPLPVPPIMLTRVEFLRGALESQYGNVRQGDRWLLRHQDAVLSSLDSPSQRLWVSLHLAAHAARTGRHSEADTWFIERRRYRVLGGDDRAAVGGYDFSQRAGNMVMAGRFNEANEVLAKAPSFESKEGHPDGNAPVRSLRWALARVQFERGDIEGAKVIVSSLPDPMRWDRDGIASASVLKSQLQYKSPSQAASGLAWLEDWMLKASRTDYEHSPTLAWLRSLAAQCALATGDRKKAAELATLARAAFTAQPGVSPYYKAPLAKVEQALGLRLPLV